MNLRRFLITALSVVCLLFPAGAALAEPWMGHLVVRDDAVWPGGRPGNYGTVKYFLDENRGETVTLEVFVQVYADGRPREAVEAQVYTNLDRRDHAKVWEAAADAGRPDSYYVTHPMTFVGQSGDNFVYKATLSASHTGAYRLTTRFRIDDGPWLWHNDFRYDGVNNQRDLAVVISPRKVLDLRIYEANPFVIEAVPGGSAGQRSTFEDFTHPDDDAFDPFHLDHLRNELGFNTLWLMPVFPVTGERYDPERARFVPNFSPGSPYATRNYWAIDGRLAAAGTEPAALAGFRELMDQAEAIGLDVFLDIAFNHAGQDAVYGQGAVDLGLAPPADAGRRIAGARPAWATSGADYRRHAGSEAEVAPYAPADRLGEHSWFDAGIDWYYGDYSSLGPKPGWGDTSRGGPLDERDLFYTDLDPAGGHDFEVENVWHYFAHLLPYWLDQTGGRLDGIRADFAQGLPSRAWEYIINRTRQRKWDFVFLAEVLDPEPVLYRAHRHFDLVTTVYHGLYRDDGVRTSDLVATLERETNIYGYNAATMHNGTSHDEGGNGNVWLMVARYAVAASLHGVPMVFMGQPLGVPHRIDFQTSWQDIKHYWDHANPGVFTLYRRINDARANHEALRSTNRYFLPARATGRFNDDVFSVARWAGDDVVLVFVNLRDNFIAPDVFAVPSDVPLDDDPRVRYQAYNLLADDPDAPLWPEARTAADIYQNGVHVRFGLPNEAQYIRLRPVG
ncbi:MAG TPA: alpha-amylase family glycosyl hydrolase [Geminicoccaceae bacterium]|nr:alpha-amylase family glycosyl hydrolase [Geminicoccaceae bacterium]